MKVEKQVKKSVKLALIFLAIGILLGTLIAFASTPSSTFYLSSGIYPGAPSFTVWREGSGYFAKDQNGQLKYSGSNASEVVNNVETSLDNVGGQIYFKIGAYYFDTSIRYYSQVTHQGEAENYVLLYYEDTSGSLFEPAEPTQSNKYAKFRDLSIVCTDENTGGLNLTSHSFVEVSNCYIVNTDGYDLNDLASDTNRIGIKIDEGAIASGYFNNIIDCDLQQWHKAIEINHGNINHITGGRCKTNFIGVNFESGSKNSVEDMDFEGNNYSIRISHHNNIIIGGYYLTSTYDIYFADNNIHVFSMGLNYEIKVHITTGSRIYGFIDSGYATSISDGDWIAHQLPWTPNNTLLTPTSNVNVWCSAMNSTHFQVGVSSGTIDLYWRVEL